jgi:hypothetical protein
MITVKQAFVPSPLSPKSDVLFLVSMHAADVPGSLEVRRCLATLTKLTTCAQAAVELGQACLGASPASTDPARRAQLRSAVLDVAAELSSSRGDDAGPSSAAVSQDDQLPPAELPKPRPDSLAREAALETRVLSANASGKQAEGTAGDPPVPQGAALSGSQVAGWAAWRVTAAAQQHDNLLQRPQAPQTPVERQRRQQQRQRQQQQTFGNGHVHGLREASEQQLEQQAIAASARQTGSRSIAPQRASDSDLITGLPSQAAIGAVSQRNVTAYSALELRKLRVACADVSCRFDASCIDHEARKPPHMVPPVPPPAEDPPAV